ncbi:hypothetical protein MtrunA17_Chr5g0407341 [Medicago truncatula]|uniref:Uncharacterized protein n=1 Tax=Medicago truncatula TaxID=3880 RepID=A0A396HPQ4_MEDTR|nr:hypothetical protein MtrunA17_Chr5g0407341 [Medicago truncatula]
MICVHPFPHTPPLYTPYVAGHFGNFTFFKFFYFLFPDHLPSLFSHILSLTLPFYSPTCRPTTVLAVLFSCPHSLNSNLTHSVLLHALSPIWVSRSVYGMTLLVVDGGWCGEFG